MLRHARHGGTGSGDEVGRAWALQVLHAPWWWRAARTALAAAAALLVVVIAEIGLLHEIEDATVAVLLTALSSLGVTAYMTWRQTRWAREIAGSAAERARPRSVLTQKLRLACSLVLAVAALTVFLQSAANSVSEDVGCQKYGKDPRFDASVAEGGGGVGRCAGPVVEGDNGLAWRVSANGSYLYWIPTLGTTMVFTPGMRAAWLAHPKLGLPTDVDRPDGDARYVNFTDGYVLENPDQPPIVLTDGSQHVPQVGGQSCVGQDRPCMTEAKQDPDGTVEVSWQYPNADGYNVAYWIVGRPGHQNTEVARPHFTLPAPERDAVYGFQVQACVKHFLARSTCTPGSNSVAVHTAP